MPDANGAFKGVGWSQKRSDAWERVFGRPALDGPIEVGDWVEPNNCGHVGLVRRLVYGHVYLTFEFQLLDAPPLRYWVDHVRLVRKGVPTQPTPEVEWTPTYTATNTHAVPLAPRLEDELADDQAARDGYNPY